MSSTDGSAAAAAGEPASTAAVAAVVFANPQDVARSAPAGAGAAMSVDASDPTLSDTEDAEADAAFERDARSERAAGDDRLSPFDFFRSIGSPRYICAPMVDASELPFRLLTRRYGATMTYTPMLHSRLFAESADYRARFLHIDESDRPLVVQFCSNQPEHLLAAAKHIEDKVDAIDINFGCPQHVAKRGRYGAFLQEDWELTASLIRILHENLRIPVFCKIRVFDSLQRTVQYAKMIENAGCQLLGVHGRTREQKGKNTGLADWEKIKAVKEALSIPVIANGNIRTLGDVKQCIARTGVDGVMSAEGLLRNPALFAGEELTPLRQSELALEYLDICEGMEEKLSIGWVRTHMWWMFRDTEFSVHTDLRDWLGMLTDSVDDVRQVILELNRRLRLGLTMEEAKDTCPLDPEKVTSKRLRQIKRKQQKKEEKRRQRELEASGQSDLSQSSSSEASTSTTDAGRSDSSM